MGKQREGRLKNNRDGEDKYLDGTYPWGGLKCIVGEAAVGQQGIRYPDNNGFDKDICEKGRNQHRKEYHAAASRTRLLFPIP